MPRPTAKQRRKADAGTVNGHRDHRRRPENLAVVARKYRVRAHLNPETEQALVDALKAGNTISNACSLVGIGQSTLYAWLKRADSVDELLKVDPEREDLADDELRYLRFRDRLSRARADAQSMAVDAVRRDMVGGELISREPVMDADGMPVRTSSGELAWKETWTQPNGRLALAFLGTSFPNEWGKTTTKRLEIVGADGTSATGEAGVTTGSGGSIQGDVIEGIANRLTELRNEREARVLALDSAQGGERAGDDDGIQDAEIVEEGT